jgi:HisJ family histidinol phosphate phosphatase
LNDNTERDPRLYAIPDTHGHAKGEHKPFTEERPLPLTARMLFLWFYHACRRGYPRFLMVADHMNYLTFEDPAAVNLVRRALKLAQAGDLYGAAETAGVDVAHAAVVGEGLRRGMRYSIGAEVDNDPRSRPDAQNIVDAMRPDAMIRSVHFIPVTHPTLGENWPWPFDNPEFKEMFDVVGADRTWELYVTMLVDAIERLPGHIVGHFFVPAVFGHWPDDASLDAYENRVLDAAEARGMAVEFNTRFLYREDDEALKARYLEANKRFLRKARDRGIGIAIGSDAHSPKDQGGAFDVVLRVLDELEINEIVFPLAGALRRVALRIVREPEPEPVPEPEPPKAPEPVAAPEPAKPVRKARPSSKATRPPETSPERPPERPETASAPSEPQPPAPETAEHAPSDEAATANATPATAPEPPEPAQSTEAAAADPAEPGVASPAANGTPRPPRTRKSRAKAVPPAAPEPDRADASAEATAAADHAGSPEPAAAAAPAAPAAPAAETAPVKAAAAPPVPKPPAQARPAKSAPPQHTPAKVAPKPAPAKAGASKTASAKPPAAKAAASKHHVPAKSGSAKAAARGKGTAAKKAAPAKAGAKKAASVKAPGKKAAPARVASKKAAPARKAAPAKKAPHKKTAPARATAKKAAPAKKTTAKKAAPARNAPARKTTAAKKTTKKTATRRR